MNCPSCGSAAVRSVPMAHVEGTHYTSGGGVAWISSAAHGQLVPITTGGITASLLAQRLAPPPRRGIPILTELIAFAAIPALLLLGTFLTAWASYALVDPVSAHSNGTNAWIPLVMGAIVLTFGVVLLVAWIRDARAVRHYNATVHPRLLAAWRAQWVCLACGRLFVPNAAD